MRLKDLYQKGAVMMLTLNDKGTDFLDIVYREKAYTMRVNYETLNNFFKDNDMDFSKVKIIGRWQNDKR